jgi:hypothetical protein
MNSAEPQHDAVDIEELAAEYVMLRELGRGAMGVVYLARHRRAAHLAAIKVIPPKFTRDENALGRLAREARTVKRLQHPNIVRYYEFRRLRAGGFALVMQYVPGETLASLLGRVPRLPAEQAENVLRDLGRALEFAHALGVVHRDVKPQNVLIDGETGTALLSDFGIAKSTEGDSDLTVTGMAIGTPFYMSPEQIEGKPVDGRSDLYSLGLVGWEMLTGMRPWAGESLYGVIYKQKHEQLPAVESLRGDVPPRVRMALEAALQKSADLRCASASEFLQQLASDQPTLATARRMARVAVQAGEGIAPAEGGPPADRASARALAAARVRQRADGPATGGSADAAENAETVQFRVISPVAPLPTTPPLGAGEREAPPPPPEFPVVAPPRAAAKPIGGRRRRSAIIAAGALVALLGVGALGAVTVGRSEWVSSRAAPWRTAPTGSRAAVPARPSRPSAVPKDGAPPVTRPPAAAHGAATASRTVSPAAPPAAPARSATRAPAAPPLRIAPAVVSAPAPAAAMAHASPQAPGTRGAPEGARAPAIRTAQVGTAQAAASVVTRPVSRAPDRVPAVAPASRITPAAVAPAVATPAVTTAPALARASLWLAERNYPRAHAVADSVIALSPRTAEAYALRARARMQQGELRSAWSDAEMTARLGERVVAEALTAMVEAKARDSVAARQRVTRLAAALSGARPLDVSEGTHLAMALAALGDRDGALDALRRVRPVNGAFRLALQDPAFDPLRSMGRFEALLHSPARADGGRRETRP